jgi:hypothetical protein
VETVERYDPDIVLDIHRSLGIYGVHGQYVGQAIFHSPDGYGDELATTLNDDVVPWYLPMHRFVASESHMTGPLLFHETARELEARGFGVELVANAPEEWADVGRVRIIGRAEDAPEVQILAAHRDEPRIDVDDRGEAEIDLVLGDGFEGLLDEGPGALDVESSVPICTEVPVE